MKVYTSQLSHLKVFVQHQNPQKMVSVDYMHNIQYIQHYTVCLLNQVEPF